AETADRGVDARRISGADAVVVQPEPPQPARPEVLDEHVGPPRQLAVPAQVALLPPGPRPLSPRGGKFSMNTWARRASSRPAARSASSRRSSAIERLFRLTPR